MNNEATNQTATSFSVSDGYLRAMLATTFVWGILLGLLVLVHFAFSKLFVESAGDFAWSASDMVLVAVGSLLVAYVSMLPGLRLSRLESSFYGAMLAGITIRLLGTVALFLTCRYQLASSADLIAGMAIGWYVLLTSIEVITLSRRLPKSYLAGPVRSSPESDSLRPDLQLNSTLPVRRFETDV